MADHSHFACLVFDRKRFVGAGGVSFFTAHRLQHKKNFGHFLPKFFLCICNHRLY